MHGGGREEGMRKRKPAGRERGLSLPFHPTKGKSVKSIIMQSTEKLRELLMHTPHYTGPRMIGKDRYICTLLIFQDITATPNPSSRPHLHIHIIYDTRIPIILYLYNKYIYPMLPAYIICMFQLNFEK
jgi:hypothetical protein